MAHFCMKIKSYKANKLRSSRHYNFQESKQFPWTISYKAMVYTKIYNLSLEAQKRGTCTALKPAKVKFLVNYKSIFKCHKLVRPNIPSQMLTDNHTCLCMSESRKHKQFPACLTRYSSSLPTFV